MEQSKKLSNFIMERNQMSKLSLHQEDLIAIKTFCDKYPESDYVTITVDSSSGIGSIVKVSLPAVINGDMVIIEKTIVDESSW
jgi:hypothetical protein